MTSKAAKNVHSRDRGINTARAWGFAGPGIVWVFAFTIFPLLYTIYLSFARTTLKGNVFAGLGNYVEIFGDYRFWSGFRVTLIFVGGSVTLTVVLGLLIALLLNRAIRGIRILRSFSILPMFAAPVALGYLGMTIFYEQGGPINNILTFLGLGQVPWLSNPRWALVSVLLVDAWQWTPFVFLVMLAALQSVPPELYEVARLDTRSGWKLFSRITLPLVRAPLGTVVILRFVEAFKVFDIPYTLTNGGPGIATRTLTYDIYTTALRNQNFGYSAAMAVLMLIIVLIVTFVFFRAYGDIYD